MNMNRREFLRGLAALAGVAAVGLPEVAETTAIELPPALQPVVGAHKSAWCWVEIDGQAHALVDAHLDVFREPTRYFLRDDAWSLCALGSQNWQMQLVTDRVAPLPETFLAGIPSDIALHLHGYVFRGRGYMTGATQYGLSDFLAPGGMVFDLSGVGPLTSELA